MNTRRIDINCDLGEGTTTADCANDALLMQFISRCNIACGGHAGNDATMALSIRNALEHNLAIGAHPGYPDPENFGRVSLPSTTPAQRSTLLDSIATQIDTLAGIAAECGAALEHIKLHGALYNDAERDQQLADTLVTMLHREFPRLTLLGLANAAMENAARDLHHPFLREGFMDRRYLNDHQLSPRTMPGAVIEELDHCLDQVMALAKGTPFHSIQGAPLQFSVHSICLHGDTPGAARIARNISQALQRAGFHTGP